MNVMHHPFFFSLIHVDLNDILQVKYFIKKNPYYHLFNDGMDVYNLYKRLFN